MKNLIGLYQLFLELVFVGGGELYVAVGVVADEMTFVVHPFDEIRMEFCVFPRDKKGRFHAALFQFIEKMGGVDRVRAVIEREGGTFDVGGGLGSGGDRRN